MTQSCPLPPYWDFVYLSVFHSRHSGPITYGNAANLSWIHTTYPALGKFCTISFISFNKIGIKSYRGSIDATKFWWRWRTLWSSWTVPAKPFPLCRFGCVFFVCFVCFKFSVRLGVMQKLDYIWVSQALTDDFSKIAILKEVDKTDGNKNS